MPFEVSDRGCLSQDRAGGLKHRLLQACKGFEGHAHSRSEWKWFIGYYLCLGAVPSEHVPLLKPRCVSPGIEPL